MKRNKIWLVSPREPSGATWLLNCFLELGVLIYRCSSRNMWHQKNGIFYLTNQEQILKKWLPSLSRHEGFRFREDLEIEWIHSWPTEAMCDQQIVYFIRDPRDSIYSRFKREQPGFSYQEFVDFLDHDSLLNKIEHWDFFNRCWLRIENLKIFRFEDYKRDAVKLLDEILSDVGIPASREEIQNAVNHSSFEKAVAAEREFHKSNREVDSRTVIRASQIGQWKHLQGEEVAVTSRIEEGCLEVLRALGYEKGPGTPQTLPVRYKAYVDKLPLFNDPFYQSLRFSKSTDPEQTKADFCPQSVTRFAQALTAEQIKRVRLEYYEYPSLMANMARILTDRQASKNIAEIAGHLRLEGGYFFQLFLKSRQWRCLIHALKFALIKIFRKVFIRPIQMIRSVLIFHLNHE